MRKRVWTTQPPAGTPIEWDSPLAQGLKFALTGSNVRWNSAGTDFPQSTTGGIGSSIGPSGPRADFYASSGYELFSANGLDGAISRLTLFSIWRAKPSQYLIADSKPVLLSTRNASNQGWTWGRVSAIGGGASGNLTSQEFTIQGVAEYDEANFTIPSLIDTPVACRIDSGTLSFFANGVRSSPDQSIASATTAGNSGLIFGKQGPYSGGGANWLDRAYITFAWLHALSDASIWTISRNPWQIFHRRQRFYSIAASTGAVFTASPTMPDAIVAAQAALSIAASAASTVPAGIAQASAALAITGSVAIAVPDGIVTAALSSGAVLTAALTAQRGIPQSSASLSIAATGAPTAPSAFSTASAALSIALTGSATVPPGMARASAGTGSVFSVAIVAQTGAISATGALSIAATGTITAAAPPVSARSALSIAGAVETAIPDAEARAAASTASGSVLSAALRMPTASPAIQAQLVVSANIAITVPDALVTAAGIIGSTPNPCMMVYLPARDFTITIPARAFTATLPTRKFTVTLKC